MGQPLALVVPSFAKVAPSFTTIVLSFAKAAPSLAVAVSSVDSSSSVVATLGTILALQQAVPSSQVILVYTTVVLFVRPSTLIYSYVRFNKNNYNMEILNLKN